MIDFKGKLTYRLVQSLADQGLSVIQVDNRLTSKDEAAAQAFIDAYNALPDWKEERIDAIKEEALKRINVVLPGIQTLEQVQLIHELWSSIVAQAKAPTTTWASIGAIYNAARTAIQAVNAATTKGQVDGVKVAWP